MISSELPKNWSTLQLTSLATASLTLPSFIKVRRIISNQGNLMTSLCMNPLAVNALLALLIYLLISPTFFSSFLRMCFFIDDNLIFVHWMKMTSHS